MKTLYACLFGCLLLALLLPYPTNCQVPKTMTYQGVLTDAAGNPVSDNSYSLTFRLYDAASGGSTLWTETQSVLSKKGLFNVLLGTTTPLQIPFDKPYWLGITIGSGSEMTPRTALSGTPYSHHAIRSDSTLGLADSVLTSRMVKRGQMVRTINGARDSVSLLAGTNIMITRSGNDLTFSSSGVAPSFPISVSGAGTFAIKGQNTQAGSGDGVVGVASAGIGVKGSTTSGMAAVYGSTNNGPYGVVGASSNATGVGVDGYSLGYGVHGNADGSPASIGVFGESSPGIGVEGTSHASGAFGVGVYGANLGTNGVGVRGEAGKGLNAVGVYGVTSTGRGVLGVSGASDGIGVSGIADIGVGATGIYGSSASGTGVHGYSTASSGLGVLGEGDVGVHGSGFTGVSGSSTSANGVGVTGFGPWGVLGQTSATDGYGVYADGGPGIGVYGRSSTKCGVYGISWGTSSFGIAGETDNGIAVKGLATSYGWAGFFDANVFVTGSVVTGSESFRFDHPLDPGNKYLQHSVVESPDMKNIYDGIIVLDASGEATVDLPAYFQALNTEFRYQLTCVGGYAPIYIASKISGNSFRIAGGRAGLEVSWQVTGVRQDPYAKAHPIVTELPKTGKEVGKYLHPVEYGVPENLGVWYELKKSLEETKTEVQRRSAGTYAPQSPPTPLNPGTHQPPKLERPKPPVDRQEVGVPASKDSHDRNKEN